jgi:uncharacterized repeat protein (TIGR03803 family)
MKNKSRRIFAMTLICLASIGLAMTLATTAFATDTQTAIYNFQNKATGAVPESGVIADSAGNLYGTTTLGGSCALSKQGCGIVFELSPSSTGWTETVLHTFAAGTADGYQPQTGLVFDSHGNLYGSTAGGGTGTACSEGCGTIFELQPQSGGGWLESILYNFTNGSDGASPTGSLVLDADGNIYGTTLGGSNSDGTVFELTTTGTFTSIFTFATGQGRWPESGVIFDSAGNLFGTTMIGGDVSGSWGCANFSGCGVVFRLTPSSTGWRYSQIYVFHGPGGARPVGGLVFDAAGNLYGTTISGGTPTYPGVGTVFEISPTTAGAPWKENLLHAFTGGTDGGYAQATLAINSAGILFGITPGAHTPDVPSTAFRLSPVSAGGWQFQLLTTLSAESGFFVTAPPYRNAAGDLFSTSYGGGSTLCNNGCGFVYELSPVTTAAK